MTKKQLIEQYEKGLLKDNAYHGTSYYTGYVLIEWTDEWAFGYAHTHLSDGIKKDFFLVQVKELNEDYSFRVKGATLKYSEFLRS